MRELNVTGYMNPACNRATIDGCTRGLSLSITAKNATYPDVLSYNLAGINAPVVFIVPQPSRRLSLSIIRASRGVTQQFLHPHLTFEIRDPSSIH